MSDLTTLTTQQQAFAIEFMSNGYDHRKAAEAAGYSPNAGVRLKRDPRIASFIASLQREHAVESLTTRTTIETALDLLQDMAMGEVPVPIVTAAGEEIEARKFHGELALRILQEKAKVAGVVKEEGKALVQVNIDMGALLGENQPDMIDVRNIDTE